mmetsp:Transcript_4929/g.10488  ORF Transcript_4929/g.10488 Transcript_4929/m.10488 type:complete len:112 (-) Transcript_4929:334-669(-)
MFVVLHYEFYFPTGRCNCGVFFAWPCPLTLVAKENIVTLSIFDNDTTSDDTRKSDDDEMGYVKFDIGTIYSEMIDERGEPITDGREVGVEMKLKILKGTGHLFLAPRKFTL